MRRFKDEGLGLAGFMGFRVDKEQNMRGGGQGTCSSEELMGGLRSTTINYGLSGLSRLWAKVKTSLHDSRSTS